MERDGSRNDDGANAPNHATSHCGFGHGASHFELTSIILIPDSLRLSQIKWHASPSVSLPDNSHFMNLLL
jgi:hypothetical protein